jgi:polysaccharide export outer membrane protein
MNALSRIALSFCAPVVLGASVAAAQQPPAASSAAGVTAKAASADPGVVVPAGYVIGADDVLSIVYWRDKDMTTDVVVRPDGKISLPLLNEVMASGSTPAQLREQLMGLSKRFFEDPSITVIVKQINSRKVFITGEVTRPGPYPLNGPTNVLQLLALAGGLKEYADSRKIVVVRTENGQPRSFPFNYKEVTAGRALTQNIELKPGDTVVVP